LRASHKSWNPPTLEGDDFPRGCLGGELDRVVRAAITLPLESHSSTCGPQIGMRSVAREAAVGGIVGTRGPHAGTS